eukprot:1378121-Amorphochlora_amoeboformis.AAC.1
MQHSIYRYPFQTGYHSKSRWARRPHADNRPKSHNSDPPALWVANPEFTLAYSPEASETLYTSSCRSCA